MSRKKVPQTMLKELDEMKDKHPELVETFGAFVESFKKFQDMQRQFVQPESSAAARVTVKLLHE